MQLEMKVHGRFAHLTDSHCNPLGRIPQGRTDTYHADCAYEWEAFRQECAREQVQAVLFSGDFFNLKNSALYGPKDLLYYSDLVRSFVVPWYGIPGNHDLAQASMVNFGVSALRLLIESTPNLVNVMDRTEILQLGGQSPFEVAIAGAPYAKLEQTFERGLPELDARLSLCGGYRIALVHTDAMPPGSKPLPGHWEMASYDDLLDALPHADLVCAGHIHHGSNIYTRPHPALPGRVQRVSKPFSFGRVVKDYFVRTEDLQDQHIPTYTLITFRSLVDEQGLIAGPIEVDFEERVIAHVPFAAAFEADSLRKVLEQEAEIEKFVRELHTRHDAILAGTDLVDVKQVYLDMQLSEQVRAKINEYLG